MNALSPIQATNITDHVYRAIERAIVHCELPPLTPISDRSLSEMLGVSRTPVREALHRLEGAGLVLRRGRSGWMVSGFSKRDIHELFEVRRLIEPFGLDRLASDRDEESRQWLARAFEGFPAPLPKEAYEEYLLVDSHFHKRIVECTRNSRIVAFYAAIEKQIDRGRHFLAMGSAGRIDDLVVEHRRICTALANGDIEEAKRALIAHLETGEQKMIMFAQQRGVDEEGGAHG